MEIKASTADIIAKGAFDGTSWSPERRESSAKAGYVAEMAEIAREFSAWETPSNTAEMAEDLEAFRSGYAARYNSYLSAHSRLVSMMIAGPSGWKPAQLRAQQKRSDSADARLGELVEWEKKTLARLRARYNPALVSRQAIRLGDAGAAERLTEKIDKLEAFQAIMREANKVVRSWRNKKITSEEAIDELMGFDGISERSAQKLLQPDFCGRYGFADYELSNNGANIRRLKERLVDVQRLAERDAETEGAGREWTFEGGTVVEDVTANRYQIFYPGKPAPEVIAQLKQHGLRWAPSIGAWQAYRTPQGAYSVTQLTGVSID